MSEFPYVPSGPFTTRSTSSLSHDTITADTIPVYNGSPTPLGAFINPGTGFNEALVITVDSKADPEGPLDFWAMGREAEVVTELLAAFHARHPTVQVRVQQLPWTAAHEKLLTAFAGDALPDLCQLGNTWVPELAELTGGEATDFRYGDGIILANLLRSERLRAIQARPSGRSRVALRKR